MGMGYGYGVDDVICCLKERRLGRELDHLDDIMKVIDPNGGAFLSGRGVNCGAGVLSFVGERRRGTRMCWRSM